MVPAQVRLIGLLSILFFFLNVPNKIFPLTELPFDEDPLINPEAGVSENTHTFQDDEGFMVGIVYGLHPALLFSPALSLAYYKNPLNVGVEISDSDRFEFWSKQKKEWLGPSRFGGSSIFAKFFLGQNIYFLTVYEKRFAHLTKRSYDRPPEGGKARFNLFAESTVGSIGFGFMNYGRLGFMAMDIFRLSQMISQEAKSEILWETWSSPGIDRYEDLKNNIQTHREDWYDTLDSPSTLVITVGLFF